jgi:RecA-family ATPase
MTGHHVPKHSPIFKNGRPIDLQPLSTIDPITWQGKPIPHREWLVHDLVPSRTVTLLSGHGGTGKSTLMLQLLVCASLGIPWLDHLTKHVKCLGLFCEDEASELHRRLAAILKHYGREFGDLENLELLDRVDQPNWLMEWGATWESGNESAFYYQLEKLVKDRGVQLLVIDSLYNVFTGSKLEERHAWEFMSALGRLSRMMDGTVLLTFHPSQSGMNTGDGSFGSVGWHNSCRSRLFFIAPRGEDGDEDRDVRELRSMKANLGPRAETMKLKWKDGAFARVDHPQGAVGSIERRNAEAVFLDCLASLTAQGVRVNVHKRQDNYAPRTMAEMLAAKGHTRHKLEIAMKRLIEAKRIKIETDGPPSRRRSFIATVERPKVEE